MGNGGTDEKGDTGVWRERTTGEKLTKTRQTERTLGEGATRDVTAQNSTTRARPGQLRSTLTRVAPPLCWKGCFCRFRTRMPKLGRKPDPKGHQDVRRRPKQHDLHYRR